MTTIKKPETSLDLAVLCAEERYKNAILAREGAFDRIMEKLNQLHQKRYYGGLIDFLNNHLDEMICCNEQVIEREVALSIAKAASGHLVAIDEVEELLYNLDVEFE